MISQYLKTRQRADQALAEALKAKIERDKNLYEIVVGKGNALKKKNTTIAKDFSKKCREKRKKKLKQDKYYAISVFIIFVTIILIFRFLV